MIYYLLYDALDQNKPYGILTSDGRFSRWKSIKDLLALPITKYGTVEINVKEYIANPDYPIVATFDYKPTAKTNPELFI